jgi:molecular chaperone DnaJ
VDTGVTMRVQGKGAEGDKGFPPGDLFVQIEVAADRQFKRKNADVFTEVEVNMADAVLGGTVDVDTLSGVVAMKIPKGTQPDAQLNMRGMGIQSLNSGKKGNQYVTLKVKIPTSLTERQVELMEEFAGRRTQRQEKVTSSGSSDSSSNSSSGSSGSSPSSSSNSISGDAKDEGGGIWGSFKKFTGLDGDSKMA